MHLPIMTAAKNTAALHYSKVAEALSVRRTVGLECLLDANLDH